MGNLIKKAAALIIRDDKLLIVKPFSRDMFVSLGGKIEGNETDLECLKRELKEEVSIDIEDDVELLGEITEKAAGDKLNRDVNIMFYIVKPVGTPIASSEIEFIHWLSLEEFQNKKITNGNDLTIASGLELFAIPKLIEKGLLKKHDSI